MHLCTLHIQITATNYNIQRLFNWVVQDRHKQSLYIKHTCDKKKNMKELPVLSWL